MSKNINLNLKLILNLEFKIITARKICCLNNWEKSKSKLIVIGIKKLKLRKKLEGK